MKDSINVISDICFLYFSLTCRFPINDIIESTAETDVTQKRIRTWKSGFKFGVVYLIHIRTGHHGASLNFRYGSVYILLKLYGDSGISNEIPIHIPLEQLFYLKCNQIDTFEIDQVISTVGHISSIDVFHNGEKEDFWHIDWINVIDAATNKSFQ